MTGNFHYDRRKKRNSRLSGGCTINYDRNKKDTVVCLLGARFWRLRLEKKDTVVCLAGAGSITTGKKKIQSSVCWVRGSSDYKKKKDRLSGGCAINYNRKKKIQSSVCWVRGSGDYNQKKKIQSSVWQVVLYVVSVFGSDGKLAVFLF